MIPFKPPCSNQQGFSLLEVLVAFTVLSISLAAISEVFSTGIRGAVTSGHYQIANSLAASKLAELRGQPSLPLGVKEGEFDGGYGWRTVVTKASWADQTLPFMVYDITLVVRWWERGVVKSISVKTAQLGSRS